MPLEFTSILGTIFLTIGGIILGKYYTEHGTVPLLKAFQTVIEGIKDTQINMPPPPPEDTGPPPDYEPPDFPPRSYSNDDYYDDVPIHTPSLDTTSSDLQTEISKVESSKRDLYLGIILIAIGIICIFL